MPPPQPMDGALKGPRSKAGPSSGLVWSGGVGALRAIPPPPSRRRTTLDDTATGQLLDLLRLKDGWYYGTGVAPSRALAMKSYLLLQLLRSVGFVKRGVFPVETGEIEVKAYAQSGVVSVLCRNDGRFDLATEKNGAEVVDREGLSEAALRRQIRGIAWQLGIQGDAHDPHRGLPH